jgi:hypothetical protein
MWNLLKSNIFVTYICQQNAWLWAWQVMLDFWQGQKFSSFQLHPDCCWGYPASNLKDKWQAA